MLFFLFAGFTQECGVSHILSGNFIAPIDVNLTETPTCFVCPKDPLTFKLNNQFLLPARPDVVIDKSIRTLFIFNWTAVQALNLTYFNTMECIGTEVGFHFLTRFFSLSKH